MQEDKVFDLLTKMYGDINNRFDNLESRFDNLEIEVKKIGAKIDGEIIPKQQALFDGYSANTEKITQLTEILEDVKVDVNNLSIKILKNENNIIEIKRKFVGSNVS
ncbi:MAG: hypothetical protein Q8900_10180 [Bacillota bacterium]|nr:hypothetical protein [Bacillota bacterium]